MEIQKPKFHMKFNIQRRAQQQQVDIDLMRITIVSKPGIRTIEKINILN